MKKGARGLLHFGATLLKIRKQIGGLSFMKIPAVSPSLYQKEQNCFGPPNFIAQLPLCKERL